MIKYTIASFIVACLIGSCTPATIFPTQLPTSTITPTFTPSTTPTELPSPTPSPVPQTQEHLLVTRDHEHWALLNANGTLQKYIQIPDIADPSDVSPDGNWLDYESGSYDAEPYDLSLNLLNLDDGTSQFVANLLSPGFPENIEPLVDATFHYDPSLYGGECADVKCRKSLVKDELSTSAGISRWSPDGQFLAFAAQIDGPSTDIYIYSMQDKTIRRLTDDLQNVERIDWSPDGKRLLYTNNIPGILHTGRTFHVTELEGKTFELSQNILTRNSEWYMHGWISNNLYLFQANYYDPPQPQFRQLIVLNAENGQLKEIWPYTTKDCVVDMNNQTVVLLFESENDPNLPPSGVYRISTNGDFERISGQMFYRLTASSQIVGEGIENGVETAYHITSDNSIIPIGPALSGLSDVSSSPDKKWFFIDDFVNARQRLTLYSDTYESITSWMFDDRLVKTSWRPDSLGIFLFTRDNIYYLEIPHGEPQLLNVPLPPWSLEGCDPVICTWPSFAWRP
jgi:WD40-like Beta Propeller Repeat